MKKEVFELPDAELVLYTNFFPEKTANVFYTSLLQEIYWQEKEIKIFGKLVKQPRLSAFYGNKNINYTYSGLNNQAFPWGDTLLEIKKLLEEKLNLQFNSCLANLYRDGNDSMGWHQDNEKELGENPLICSVTFGDTRTFQLKHILHKNCKLKIELLHGSVLIMSGATQHYYNHSLSKTKKKVGPRVNLTFRNIKK